MLLSEIGLLARCFTFHFRSNELGLFRFSLSIASSLRRFWSILDGSPLLQIASVNWTRSSDIDSIWSLNISLIGLTRVDEKVSERTFPRGTTGRKILDK